MPMELLQKIAQQRLPYTVNNPADVDKLRVLRAAGMVTALMGTDHATKTPEEQQQQEQEEQEQKEREQEKTHQNHQTHKKPNHKPHEPDHEHYVAQVLSITPKGRHALEVKSKGIDGNDEPPWQAGQASSPHRAGKSPT